MSVTKWLAIGAACFAFALPTAGAQETKEYSVSTVLSADFPWGQAAEKWAELVEERTDGRITLKVYPNSQLVSGDQTREFSAMRSGIIDRCMPKVWALMMRRGLGALWARWFVLSLFMPKQSPRRRLINFAHK